MFSFLLVHVLDKTGSLPVSFPVQIIYRIVSYRIVVVVDCCLYPVYTMKLARRAGSTSARRASFIV